jgi:hypothetical protein
MKNRGISHPELLQEAGIIQPKGNKVPAKMFSMGHHLSLTFGRILWHVSLFRSFFWKWL